jgi:hypothetical protein
MTSYLFGAWMSHFIKLVRASRSILPNHRHLLILDGHISHVSVEVVKEAKRANLGLFTLPSYISHALQPLDVSVFKPFKQFFWQFGDFWMSRNFNEEASKDTLAQWVSLSLKKALTEGNIKKGSATLGKGLLMTMPWTACLYQSSESFQSVNLDVEGSSGIARGAGLIMSPI